MKVLGLADLRTTSIVWDDYWTWCRQHEQASLVGLKCHDSETPTVWYPLSTCVRIGPFMSEREAGRLAGASQRGVRTHLTRPPLGMKVEE